MGRPHQFCPRNRWTPQLLQGGAADAMDTNGLPPTVWSTALQCNYLNLLLDLYTVSQKHVPLSSSYMYNFDFVYFRCIKIIFASAFT